MLTGGSWTTGNVTAGPGLVLPGLITPDQVQGLRFTFTRADGANWENPATPTQPVTFQVQRRDTLNTGGPVLPDLAAEPAVARRDRTRRRHQHGHRGRHQLGRRRRR